MGLYWIRKSADTVAFPSSGDRRLRPRRFGLPSADFGRGKIEPPTQLRRKREPVCRDGKEKMPGRRIATAKTKRSSAHTYTRSWRRGFLSVCWFRPSVHLSRRCQSLIEVPVEPVLVEASWSWFAPRSPPDIGSSNSSYFSSRRLFLQSPIHLV